MADVTDTIAKLDPPPLATHDREEELCVAYEAAFAADRETWIELAAPAVERLEKGSFSLEWMNTDGGAWGTKVNPSSRGLTFMDCNRSKAYGTIAASVPDHHRNLTPGARSGIPTRTSSPSTTTSS